MVTPEEITPTKQGTNQKGGGKNKNKREGSHSGGGSQRGGNFVAVLFWGFWVIILFKFGVCFLTIFC